MIRIGLLKYNIFLKANVDINLTELRFVFFNIQTDFDYSRDLSDENIKMLLEKFITKRFMLHELVY